MRTWVEINRGRLTSNLALLQARVPSASVMAVVKADAYGHGAVAVAEALTSSVKAFAVATVAEALALRQGGIAKPVLVFGALLEDEIESAVAAGLMLTVSSVGEIRRLAAAAGQRRVSVSLKIDTGMGRLGVLPAGLPDVLAAIESESTIDLRLLATHLPSADCDPEFTGQQLREFQALSTTLKSRVPGVEVHALNSAGILRHANFAFDLVRPGLALYGVSPIEDPCGLQPVLQWKTRISLLREVPAGQGVSYGRSFVTKAPTRLAVLPVGYADGYRRAFSNRAEVLLHGRRCPVVGKVTMDLTIVDVTAVAAAREGDEVTLLGEQDGENIGCGELAKWAGTIPWEILTGLGNRVERVISPL